MCTDKPAAACSAPAGGGVATSFCFTCPEADSGTGGEGGAPGGRDSGAGGEGGGSECGGVEEAPFSACTIEAPAVGGELRKHVILERPPVQNGDYVRYIAPGEFCFPNWLACQGKQCASCSGDTCGAGTGTDCDAMDLSTLQLQVTVEVCATPGAKADGTVTLSSVSYIPESCLCANGADCAPFADRSECAPEARLPPIDCGNGVPCSGVCSPAP
jgi:hypothetical protein